ncbi:MAG: hypothetical protein ABL962_21560, partial [Fimbriimonadaceae bacterium]
MLRIIGRWFDYAGHSSRDELTVNWQFGCPHLRAHSALRQRGVQADSSLNPQLPRAKDAKDATSVGFSRLPAVSGGMKVTERRGSSLRDARRRIHLWTCAIPLNPNSEMEWPRKGA